MATKICHNTIIAEARFAAIPNTPESIKSPDASAEPTYPGAAGIK